MISDTLAIYMNVFFVLYPLGPYESIRQYPFVREEKRKRERKRKSVFIEEGKKGVFTKQFQTFIYFNMFSPPLISEPLFICAAHVFRLCI